MITFTKERINVAKKSGGWVSGWLDVKGILRIACSYQKPSSEYLKRQTSRVKGLINEFRVASLYHTAK